VNRWGFSPVRPVRCGFAEFFGHKVAKLDTRSNIITEYPVPNGGKPFELAPGPNGTLWFTVERNDAIGSITSDGHITQVRIPTPQSRPYDIAVGSDGAFWFEEGTANKIGRITSSGQVTNEYSIPTPNSGAHAITAGPDGQIWFSEIFANKIASIATH
jgi:virginiamycin B lyase